MSSLEKRATAPQGPLLGPTPGIMRLADETLLNIFDLGESSSREQRRDLASRLRLTCRRFRDVSSHWLIEQTTVDISRPETLERFHGITSNPSISHGVREIFLRLHFYHPWVSSSVDNFASAIYSEWYERIRPDYEIWNYTSNNKALTVGIEAIMQDFLGKMEQVVDRNNGVVSVCTDELGDTQVKRVLDEAYASYKAKFEAQNALLQGGLFLKSFAESFAALPAWRLHSLTMFDGDLKTNGPMWRNTELGVEDAEGQHDALVQCLSRPMLWEEARLAGTRGNVWRHVPVNMLIDVLIAMGKHGGVILDDLRVFVSSAPDYELLKTEPERLQCLTSVVKSMDLWHFHFKPAIYCSPFVGSEPPDRTVDEMKALNRYIGAIVAGQSLGIFNVDLGEFWVSIGIEHFIAMPVSVGTGFDWPVHSQINSICLGLVNLTAVDFGKIGAALMKQGQLDVSEFYLREGTWAEVLHQLRGTCKKPRVNIFRRVRDKLNEEQSQYLFGLDEHGCSRAYRFITGEDIPNPLDSLPAEEQ